MLCGLDAVKTILRWTLNLKLQVHALFNMKLQMGELHLGTYVLKYLFIFSFAQRG